MAGFTGRNRSDGWSFGGGARNRKWGERVVILQFTRQSHFLFFLELQPSNLPTKSNLYPLHLNINIIHYSTKRHSMNFLLSGCEVESDALGGTNFDGLEDVRVWPTSLLSGALRFIVRTLLSIQQFAAFTYHRLRNGWSWGLRFKVLRQNWYLYFSCLARRRHKVRNGLLGASDTPNYFTLHGNWDRHSLSRIFASSSEEFFVPYHFQPYSDEYLIIVLGSMEMERCVWSFHVCLTFFYSLVRYIPSPPIEKATLPGSWLDTRCPRPINTNWYFDRCYICLRYTAKIDHIWMVRGRPHDYHRSLPECSPLLFYTVGQMVFHLTADFLRSITTLGIGYLIRQNLALVSKNGRTLGYSTLKSGANNIFVDLVDVF